MKRALIAGLATTMMVSGSLGLAGVEAGSAVAEPDFAPLASWCPGQPLPGNVAGDWDMSACHDWHYSWHDDPAAPPGQVVQGPLDCRAIFPQCLG
jgi:hypothetical protein